MSGVDRGQYTSSHDNKGYALKAVDLLRVSAGREDDANQLWSDVLRALGLESKRHNSQMDVVISLWNEGLINALDGR